MPVKRIAFDELLPDLPFTGEANGMAEAVNILPLDSRWLPSKKSAEVAAVFDVGDGASDLLVHGGIFSYVRGKVILGVDRVGGIEPVKLWEVNEGAGTMTDRSKGGYTQRSDNTISFTEFNDFLIATWLYDPVQYIDASAAAFADLITSTTKPKAKFACTSKIHLVLGWINEGGSDFPRRIWWSAQGDPQDFDVGSARSGFLDLDAGDGEITGVTGFEDFFIVFTERKVIRFDYIGGEEVWFPVEIGSGPEGMVEGASRSAVKRAGGLMYRGRDGYKVASPDGSIANLGEGKIRSFVREASNSSISLPGALDGVSGLALWIGAFGFELGSDQGAILAFNPVENRFSVLDDVVESPFAIGASTVQPVYAPDDSDSDGVENVMWCWYDFSSGEIRAFRTNSTTYGQTLQKSRLIEPVPGGVSQALRCRPLVELEEGGGKTVPTIQVKIEGWNDLYKKTAAFPAVTLDTDDDLNSEGWLVGSLPRTANRWEFTVIVPEIDSSTEYVPINLLGLDVEFDEFSER